MHIAEGAFRICNDRADTHACLMTLDYMCKTVCNREDTLYADICWKACTAAVPNEIPTASSSWTCTPTDTPNEVLRCTSPRVVQPTPLSPALNYGYVAENIEYMYGLPRKEPTVWIT